MSKAEWGKKRICTECSTKFYDFKKSPITCPKCNTEINPNSVARFKKSKVQSVSEESAIVEEPSILDDAETGFDDLSADFSDDESDIIKISDDDSDD